MDIRTKLVLDIRDIKNFQRKNWDVFCMDERDVKKFSGKNLRQKVYTSERTHADDKAIVLYSKTQINEKQNKRDRR